MKNLLLAIGILMVGACSGPYQLAKHTDNNIRVIADSLQLYDTAIANMIAPYKQKLDAQMNEVIGEAESTLTKELPDGTLGNFVADACLVYAQNNNATADFCVLNSGGVRIPTIQKGSITVGKIYELMPFDNMIEVVELDGTACKELFAWIAKWKGAPVSGIELTLENGEATNVKIKDEPFNESKTYFVATTDYIANGGDGANMFAKGKRSNYNYKLRDAIIDYVKTKQTIKADNNGRIKQN
ncbi:MAG: 5'-nucleotidase C-terminal domain-containing protein [Bacteroidia bacterium]